MASVAFSAASASDLLRSSCNGVSGVPLRSLGRSRMGARGRRQGLSAVTTVAAKMRKAKKHEYPWPDHPDKIDPSVRGGFLSQLSRFKPLKEKPKPVTLPFEKPLMDLKRKIIDVRKMADETGLDFSDQIMSLESKYQQALKDLYTHLTPIQRVTIARHPNRPTFLDHVLNITDKWVELHGDRAGYDDPAIVTGIGSIDGRSYMFIGQQKGRNTKENIQRNFGMPTPHGYRKALRMLYYADHHGLPIITFIDTPGAFADLKSEELGQGEAIAHNLRTMFGLKVPIVAVVIGEGGSGGALAIGCANKLLMLENAVFYVASPEACAAILWKSAKASPKAAEKLKITATELCKLKIADGVIPEPLGGAHADPSWTSQQIKQAVVGSMNELLEMDMPELLHQRMLKFRSIGGFVEGESIDPAKKVNMKKKEEPTIQQEKLASTSDLNLYNVEKFKQQILGSKGDSSSESLDLGLNEIAEKLKKQVDEEFTEAAKSMGLGDRLEILRKEVSEARSSRNQLMDPSLLEEIEKLKEEFKQALSEYPNFAGLSYKLDMLKELSKAQKMSEGNKRVISLKQEINKRFKEIAVSPDVKKKMDMLKAEISIAGVSKASDLDNRLKEKIMKVKKEIEFELAKTLNSLHLTVALVASKGKSCVARVFIEQSLSLELKDKIYKLNHDIEERIQGAITSTDLKNKIKLLKLEVAKAGTSSDPESKSKIEAMKQEIKQGLAEKINSPSLTEKYEKLKQEITEASLSSSDELEKDQGFNTNALKEGDPKLDTSRVEINMGATSNRS